jgi:TctA family transporter
MRSSGLYLSLVGSDAGSSTVRLTMRRINQLRGIKRYLAWVVIGLVIGFLLAVLDHYLEPDQPFFVLPAIGLIAGLTQAFYSERASRSTK